MASTTWHWRASALFGILLVGGCMPLRDLDRAAAGSGGVAGQSNAGGMAGGGGTTSNGGAGGMMTSDASIATGGAAGSGGGAGAGGVEAAGGAAGGNSAVDTGATGGTVSPVDGGFTVDVTGGVPGSPAPDLPDIPDSPVTGTIIYSEGASWDIDGSQWPAFEIHTPTANYWLVKASGAIVSMTDKSNLQWINFSSGFRPNRGVPNLGGCCQPGNPTKLGLPTMVTEVDPSFLVTSTHLRLVSKATDESYWLVWDFFLSHFTLTINRAQRPFGFTYRGVPSGSIGPSDQLVLSNGAIRSVNVPFAGDLPGPVEWAYLTHPSSKQSLFLIQHGDDDLPETYQVVDTDTPMFTFASGQMTRTPIRFSLGLVNSCDEQAVRDRIAFVRDAIPK